MASYNRGGANQDRGCHGEAIADYDQALHQDPDHVHAYTNRGVAKFHLGRHTEASTDFDQALRWAPDTVEAYL